MVLRFFVLDFRFNRVMRKFFNSNVIFGHQFHRPV